MRRLRAVLIACVLSHGCVHGLVAGSGDTSTGSAQCSFDDVCGGGGGDGDGVADEVVAGAVVGVVVGAVAVAVYRRLVHGASR